MANQIDMSTTPQSHPAATLCTLPTELLWHIADHLDVVAISRLQQVNRHLNAAIDNAAVWRPLYRSVFRFDQPLTHRAGQRYYEFDQSSSTHAANPWRTGFRLLYGAVHVRPGFDERRCRGRRNYCDSLAVALNIARMLSLGVQPCHHHRGRRAVCTTSMIDTAVRKQRLANRHLPHAALILVHRGDHQLAATQTIDWPVAIVGAAPGPPAGIAAQVRLRNGPVLPSLVRFVEGAASAYFGHLTLQMRPAPLERMRCISVFKGCTPTIDWCRLLDLTWSEGMSQLISVIGPGAAPLVRHCLLQTTRPDAPGFDANNIVYGVRAAAGAGGTYEYNSISFIRAMLGAQIDFRPMAGEQEQLFISCS